MQEPKRTSSPVLLEVKGLEVAYGKAKVIHGIDFQVRQGEFVVLLGRNGAGKSTTLHALCGLIPKQAGSVRFKDRDISRLEPRAIVREGIVNVLEGHRVFTGLTVEDNLLIGTYAKKSGGDKSKLERIYDLFPEIGERRHQLASRLSGGQQQILAVGQGIIADPQLLILDEPSGGLAPIVVDRILKVAKELCRSGIAILLVEQLVREALKFADYCYLVETGRIGGQGTSDEVRSGELIQRIYLGS
ncbi:ABC transporter ATP-binding protein [Variovorax rhizosphaerae]|uniref:ABC transporter ATP-binding protein n=1 Tax=Variovorax rhizosphaerae TaxID=1836200 RepID=A0ABU8WV48_9BURK